MTPQFPLSSSTWGREELSAIEEVINSGQMTYGKRVQGFERSFAEYMGSRGAVMVNSGSSANLLAVAVMREVKGLSADRNEIIVPAIGWATSYFPFNQLGYRMVVVDVNPHTLNIDIERVKEAVGPRTAGVLGIDVLGTASGSRDLRELADREGIFYIEDSCESMGAIASGQFAGTFGHIGTFSTYFSHHISTIEGGLLVSDDEEILNFAMSMRSHGWGREVSLRSLGVQEQIPPEALPFTFALPGFNFRPTEIQGALGEVQLEKLEGFIESRKANGAKFSEATQALSKFRFQHHDEGSSWFAFAFWLGEEFSGVRGKLFQELHAAGIETRPVVGGAIHLQPVWNRLNARTEGSLDVSAEIHTNGLMVGNHHFNIGPQILELTRILHRLEGEL